MNTKIQKTILGGIIGTAIMSLVMFFMPLVGLAKMAPQNLLSNMMGKPIYVGWLLHFIIGIIFAFVYTYLGLFKWRISNIYLKGAVFGILVFVVGQIFMHFLQSSFGLPKMEGSIIHNMLGGFLANLFYGIAVVVTIGNINSEEDTYDTSQV